VNPDLFLLSQSLLSRSAFLCSKQISYRVQDHSFTPQRWLKSNRRIDAASDAGCLGMQMVPSKEAIGAVIRVGDVVKVLKRGEHLFVANPDPEAQRPVL